MPKVWLLIAAFFCTTWTIQAVTVDMPLFAYDTGFDELLTGKLLTGTTAGMVVACLISGKCSDFAAARAKNKAASRILVLMVGPLLIVASVAALKLLDVSDFMMLYVINFLFSFGGSWGLGSFYCILPEFFSGDKLAAVTGFAGGIGDAGMPLAPLVVGVIFGVRGMWDVGWMCCGVIAVISFIAAVALITFVSGKEKKEHGESGVQG